MASRYLKWRFFQFLQFNFKWVPHELSEFLDPWLLRKHLKWNSCHLGKDWGCTLQVGGSWMNVMNDGHHEWTHPRFGRRSAQALHPVALHKICSQTAPWHMPPNPAPCFLGQLSFEHYVMLLCLHNPWQRGRPTVAQTHHSRLMKVYLIFVGTTTLIAIVRHHPHAGSFPPPPL